MSESDAAADPAPLTLRDGEAIRLLVDDTVYAIDVVQPASRIDQSDPDRDEVTDIELLPMGFNRRVKSATDAPRVEMQFVSTGHGQAIVEADTTPPDRTPYLDDVLADFHVVRGLLNDGRPLEALSHLNDAIDRLEGEIDE
jgi:hypothetical protein